MLEESWFRKSSLQNIYGTNIHLFEGVRFGVKEYLKGGGKWRGI